MTGAAIYEVSGGIHVIPGNQLLTSFQLIWRRLPRHIEDLVAWADVLFGIAVAIQAPPHVKRLRFARQRHLIHSTMAVRAADSLGHVNAVIEIDVARQIIYPDPF